MEEIISFFKLITSFEQTQIIFKIILISILTGILGYERESWKKPAGLRTYVLVGISGVLIMLVGQKLHEHYGADAARIPAQLISGIGFLGAGTILRDGFQVKGLTTAAGLLASACIGLAVGTGYYFCAIIATIVVYCILSYAHLIPNTGGDYNTVNIKILTNSPKEVIKELKDIFNSEKIEMINLRICDENSVIVYAKSSDRIDTNKLFTKIMKIETADGVSENDGEVVL